LARSLKGTGGIVKWVWEKRASGGVAPAYAASTIVYVAGDPNIQSSRDVYWKEFKPLKPSGYSQKPDEAGRLWELSEKMCGIASADYGIGERKRGSGIL
jgi:hypothetical protein